MNFLSETMDAYLQSWFVQKQNGDTIFYPGYGRKGYLIEDEITYKKFCKLMKMKHLFGAIFRAYPLNAHTHNM
jgi:hypothetical protein